MNIEDIREDQKELILSINIMFQIVFLIYALIVFCLIIWNVLFD